MSCFLDKFSSGTEYSGTLFYTLSELLMLLQDERDWLKSLEIQQ